MKFAVSRVLVYLYVAEVGGKVSMAGFSQMSDFRASCIAASLVTGLLGSGCGFTVSKQDPLAEAGAAGRVLGYTSLRARIFQPRCISCHGTKGGVSLETYQGALSALTLIADEVVAEKTMPPRRAGGPLSVSDQELILAWVNAGGPENDVDLAVPEEPTVPASPVPEPTPSGPVSYAQVRARIFRPKCVRCHGTKGGVNLETYSSILSVLDKVEREALVKRKMPPKHPLSAAKQAWLRAWIDEGAPRDAPTQ